ncbi:MAG: adenylyl-sulfate kinase [Chitinophagaceae bacterium]|nr:adenylyl-sulfate kinase [Chitinophagaceae bacterium]
MSLKFRAAESPEDIASIIFSSLKEEESGVLRQKGVVVWLTGLSGSGKTTVAGLLNKRLAENHFLSVVLDGDELRKTLNKDLGFSEADRAENIRRAAELAKLLARKNIIVICSFITPLQKHRRLAAAITEDRFFEVFLDCPLSVCEQRDVKGLYRKARNNEIPDFTGIGSAFEPGVEARLILHTDVESATESMEKLYAEILPGIQPAAGE